MSVHHWFDQKLKGQVYGRAISCFRAWISATSGTGLGIEKNTSYFGADVRVDEGE